MSRRCRQFDSTSSDAATNRNLSSQRIVARTARCFFPRVPFGDLCRSSSTLRDRTPPDEPLQAVWRSIRELLSCDLTLAAVPTIELTSASLVVHIRGADQFFALASGLEVPLEHIAGVDPNVPGAHGISHGLRVGGTNVPGLITAGLKGGKSRSRWLHTVACAALICSRAGAGPTRDAASRSY